MKRNFILVGFIFIAMQLVGCAGNVKPESSAPVVDSTAPAETPVAVEPEVPVVPEPQPVVQQPKVYTPPPTTNAIASLATQARAQYQAKNYQGAVATAERGLRIDRRAPELYLILAQSYVQLANIQLAQQFVQQGIRYAQMGTEVAQSLAKVKDSLPK